MHRGATSSGPLKVDALRAGVVLLAALGCQASGPVQPALDAEQGFAFESPLLHPGKLDLLVRSRPETDERNAFWWSPFLKGGAGTVDPDHAEETTYAGGYVRPLLGFEEAGELIVGGLAVDAAGADTDELQAEYRAPFGLGVGAGYADFPDDVADVRFAKLAYRTTLDRWQVILAGLVQETGDDTDPGAYVAVHDEQWLGAAGDDGEQWRTTLSYIAPERDGLLRPALEGLFVDNSIGGIDGPKLLFINGTLRFGGGFLSHPAALGRAMGPQGLEYGNPLGFAQPTWNRRLDTWELGGVFDLRVVRLELPNGAVDAEYEVLAFPAQLAGGVDGPLAGFLVGAFHATRSIGDDTPGLLAGYSGAAGPLSLSLVVRQELETDDTSVVVGAIVRF